MCVCVFPASTDLHCSVCVCVFVAAVRAMDKQESGEAGEGDEDGEGGEGGEEEVRTESGTRFVAEGGASELATLLEEHEEISYKEVDYRQKEQFEALLKKVRQRVYTIRAALNCSEDIIERTTTRMPVKCMDIPVNFQLICNAVENP